MSDEQARAVVTERSIVSPLRGLSDVLRQQKRSRAADALEEWIRRYDGATGLIAIQESTLTRALPKPRRRKAAR